MTIAAYLSATQKSWSVCASDTIPEQGFSTADVSQIIAEHLAGDRDPRANLGKFATTSMEPEADRLLMQTINKNLIDQYAYPGLEEIHQQVIAMLSELFHAPQSSITTGMATVGSSEAIMLGLLAHKFSWRARRQRAGRPIDRPNIVMGSHVHVCWHKFARFFDVSYTGGCLSNFSLNFSRPGAMVVLQYYNFLRHGKAGYRDIVARTLDNARYLEAQLRKTGAFDVLSDADYLPIVVPCLNTRNAAIRSVAEISRRLRERGWIVPAYGLPVDQADRQVLRMVVKQDWTSALTDELIRDIRHIMAGLD